VDDYVGLGLGVVVFRVNDETKYVDYMCELFN
jgi:hypothetical protein